MSSSRFYKPYSIAGKVTLVTGASAGIGEAIAWRMADAGAKLILVARRSDRLLALQKAILAEFPDARIHCVTLDVRKITELTAMVLSLPTEFREIDILVNNAGLALGVDATDEVNLDNAQQMLETNVLAVVALTKVVSQGMKARNSGHIINISSVAAHESYARGGVYCATKHAIDALTTAALHDFVDTDIRVTAISPGAVKTEFSVVRFGGDTQKADDVYAGIDPLTAADIADNVRLSIYHRVSTSPPRPDKNAILTLESHPRTGIVRVWIGSSAPRHDPPAPISSCNAIWSPLPLSPALGRSRAGTPRHGHPTSRSQRSRPLPRTSRRQRRWHG